jgi:phosphoglycolate phosphatase-like HAD superfamily hydrolase
MIKLNNFDFVIFDFDGVLVDSTTMKTQIFLDVVSKYSKAAQDEFIIYHKLHGGVSRWEKFDYFLREIVKLTSENDIIKTSKTLVDDFSEILGEKLKNLTLTEGALPLLKNLEKAQKSCFIVSGAFQDEVREVVKNNQISSYFSSILGSPKNKKENILSLKDQGQLIGKGIFIGDSFTDYTSARDFEMKFIFMKRFTEWKNWKLEESNFSLVVDDLKELNAYIINEDV